MKPYATARTIRDKAAGWLATIEPYNTHRMNLNVGASALLIVDMQMFFLDPRPRLMRAVARPPSRASSGWRQSSAARVGP